jgi:hypothetical protein
MNFRAGTLSSVLLACIFGAFACNAKGKVEGVDPGAFIMGDKPTIARLPAGNALAMVTAKWGEPVVGEESGKPTYFWFNPEQKLRASLREGTAGEFDLRFDQYEAMARLLGDGKDIAFLSKVPVWGATADQVQAAYGEWFQMKSFDEALATHERELIDTESARGGRRMRQPRSFGLVELDLPPTEYGRLFSRVKLQLDLDGKVFRCDFGFSYKFVPAKKDEIFGLFEKKWGKPEPLERPTMIGGVLVGDGRPAFVFSTGEPQIIVELNADIRDWTVHGLAGTSYRVQ